MKLHVTERFLCGRGLEAVFIGGHQVGSGSHVLGAALYHLAHGVGGGILREEWDGGERKQEKGSEHSHGGEG